LLCFFFSSRRRHTRSKRDWSSDVCSSDLLHHGAQQRSSVGSDLLPFGPCAHTKIQSRMVSSISSRRELLARPGPMSRYKVSVSWRTFSRGGGTAPVRLRSTKLIPARGDTIAVFGRASSSARCFL